VGLASAAAIAAAEATARRLSASRSAAWIGAYGLIGSVAAGRVGWPAKGEGRFLPGLLLAAAGYDLGRRLGGDLPHRPPAEPWLTEAVAAATVATGEELSWGAVVEPRLGAATTAALFAVKHPLIDGRWGRVAGLAAFWWGLAWVRRRNPRAALVVHVVLNVGGVVRGHLSGRDQF
jgi:hypothetical protein